jgi:hypothetical protein
MYPTFSRRSQRPKTHVTNPFRRASSHRSHPALLKRFDITGARRGLDGTEAILTLRAVISNGDFDDYSRYHLAREHQPQPKASHSA